MCTYLTCENFTGDYVNEIHLKILHSWCILSWYLIAIINLTLYTHSNYAI